ncbi:MAG: (2Fe-2S)-binding protein [Actinomycetes bacterium]|jgi:bacterioferritin-associated ferredoxin|nr:MAG: (2Fe-2S)-binding protein [Actinomycetota bacterium]
MYACVCRAVTESEIYECIAAGAKSAKQIRDATGAGSDCAICIRRICTMLKRSVELATTS